MEIKGIVNVVRGGDCEMKGFFDDPPEESEPIDRIKERLTFLKRVQYKDLKQQYMWCMGFLVALVDYEIISQDEYSELLVETQAVFKDRQERKA